MNQPEMTRQIRSILVLDDQEKHARDVAALLSGINPAGAADPSIDFGAAQVKWGTSVEAHIAAWTRDRRCPIDLIVCDLHMPPGDGARAVFDALEDIYAPHEAGAAPYLIVMTQRVTGEDPVAVAISRDAGADLCRTKPLVIPKVNSLADVEQKERQYDPLDWQDIILRAVRARHQVADRRLLQAEINLANTVADPLRRLAPAIGQTRGEKVVLAVTEPEGLLQQLTSDFFANSADAFAMEGLRFVGQESALMERLATLRDSEGLVVTNADWLVRGMLEGDSARWLRILETLRANLVPVPAGGTLAFPGTLWLCVAPPFLEELEACANGDTATSAARGLASFLLHRLPKLHFPVYAAMRAAVVAARTTIERATARADLEHMIGFMANAHGLKLGVLDRIGLVAHDWAGGNGDGIAALRGFIHQRSRGQTREDGAMLAYLCQKSFDAGRPIHTFMREDELLLYILWRMDREITSPEKPAQQAVAYLLVKVLATQSDAVDRERVGAALQHSRYAATFKVPDELTKVGDPGSIQDRKCYEKYSLPLKRLVTARYFGLDPQPLGDLPLLPALVDLARIYWNHFRTPGVKPGQNLCLLDTPCPTT